MGAAQSIPVVGEAFTAIEVASKTLAAGACALVGKHKQADELMEGAKRSWVNYTEVNLVVGGLRTVINDAQGNTTEADRLRKKQKKAWHNVLTSTPGVGHIIGLYHYATGDQKGGDEAMINATKSTVVAVVGVATGGAGFVAAGGFSAATALAYDVATTKITGEDQGFVKAVNHAEETGNADDAFNAAEDPASAFLAEGLSKVKVGRNPIARAFGKEEKSTLESILNPSPGPDHDDESERPDEAPSTDSSLNNNSSHSHDQPTDGHALSRRGGGRSNSVLSKYGHHRSKKISAEKIQSHPEVTERFHEVDDPADAMRVMERGRSYDFVRMKDGRVRMVDHDDATSMADYLHADASTRESGIIAHASLVKESERHEVVSAGEATCGLEKVLDHITPGAGRFQLPVQLMTRLINEYFPHGVLVLDSPLYTRLIGLVTSQSAGKSLKGLYVYMTNMMVVATDDDDSYIPPSSEHSKFVLPLSSCDYFIVVKEPVGTKMLGFLSKTAAHRCFDSLPDDLPAYLLCKSEGSVLDFQHPKDVLSLLSQYLVNAVNLVMPSGNWRDVCSNGEAWRDPGNSKYEFRCTHTDSNGDEVLHEMSFSSSRSIVDFKDGRLVLGKDLPPQGDE